MISHGLLRWKLEMHMIFENRLYMYGLSAVSNIIVPYLSRGIQINKAVGLILMNVAISWNCSYTFYGK